MTRPLDVVRFDETAPLGPELSGRMMPYNEWTEIRNGVEGHFLEQFSPGALADAVCTGLSRVKVLFQHGEDKTLGRQQIAKVESLVDRPDGAYFRARLLDGVPELLVSGLKAGLYGSSIRFEPVQSRRKRFPPASEWNPDRIPEVTVFEARVREFSVVSFPQYAGATAILRVGV